MKTVKFNRLYPKLKYPWFNTIRKSTDLEEGEEVLIQTPMARFQAHIVFVKEWSLHEIPTSTLTWDTDTLTREEALEELRRYYPKLNWQSRVVMVGFKRRDNLEEEVRSRWEDGY